MKSQMDAPAYYTSIEVARLLGLGVRSVQLMVDRGELQGWKTSGGHRRISSESVDRWMADNRVPSRSPSQSYAAPTPGVPRVLLVEDSAYYQNVVSLLIKQFRSDVELHIADDGIAGLAMYGRLQPQVLIVDILLPGIDGATLIASLRTHPQFSASELIVITSLDEAQRAPFEFALAGVQVAHKSRLAAELPAFLEASLSKFQPQQPQQQPASSAGA